MNCPSALVTASDVGGVGMFFTMTLAPGMTAPDVSVTVPDERRRGAALGECCGRRRGPATASAKKATANSLRAVLVMNCSLVRTTGNTLN